MNSINKVFDNADLKKEIFKFFINKRCMSCHSIMNFTKEHKDIKDYTNLEWCKRSNKNDNKCCNCCYYYVWGIY